MSKFLILLITILNLNKIKAQDSLLFGNCIKSPVISDFNIEKYTGKWFGIEHTEAPFKKNIKCETAIYTQQNATHITVDNKGINMYNNNTK
jgi:lipocalin